MVQELPVVKEGSETPRKVRPPVDPSTMAHRDLRTGAWWREIPAFADVDEATFHDHRWQMKHTITKPETLLAAVSGLASEGFLKDAAEGFRKAPMAVRVSPYMISLVDWKNPYEDPIRRQFLPTASSRLADHPKLTFDSLGEQSRSRRGTIARCRRPMPRRPRGSVAPVRCRRAGRPWVRKHSTACWMAAREALSSSSAS